MRLYIRAKVHKPQACKPYNRPIPTVERHAAVDAVAITYAAAPFCEGIILRDSIYMLLVLVHTKDHPLRI